MSGFAEAAARLGVTGYLSALLSLGHTASADLYSERPRRLPVTRRAPAEPVHQRFIGDLSGR